MLKNISKIGIHTAIRHRSSQTCGRCGRCGQSFIKDKISLAFGRYLLLTNTVASGILLMVGDACQQQVEYYQKKKSKRIDYERLRNMFIVGAAMGPLNHYFYEWLEANYPSRSWPSTRKKLILDQVLMGPVCILIFFYSMCFIESVTLPSCNDEVKKKFVDVYIMDCIILTPSQVINFFYVPAKYQVIYVNAVAVAYGMLLSYYKHLDM